MKYLFIAEDYSIWTAEEITPADKESIEVGALTVIKFEDGDFWDMDPNGKFEQIHEG